MVKYSRADARLVGGHGHGVARFGEKGNRVHAACNRYPFIGGFNEIIAILVNHAIAVEDNQLHKNLSDGL